MDLSGEVEKLRQPILFIDVNLGGQNTESTVSQLKRPERIVVCEGDTAENLAYEFCEKHFPPDEDRRERQNMELKLAELLQ